jgi:hypothetical protein
MRSYLDDDSLTGYPRRTFCAPGSPLPTYTTQRMLDITFLHLHDGDSAWIGYTEYDNQKPIMTWFTTIVNFRIPQLKLEIHDSRSRSL